MTKEKKRQKRPRQSLVRKKLADSKVSHDKRSNRLEGIKLEYPILEHYPESESEREREICEYVMRKSGGGEALL